MKKLYIFRGCPGSGKSTLAHTLAPLVVEPDMFRYTADMEYVFDSGKNSDVMKKTEDLLKYAMRHLKMSAVAVAATHVKIAHIENYISLGKKYGYQVTVFECYGNYGNVHNVPDAVMARMGKEFEILGHEKARELGVTVRVHRKGEENK